MQSLTDNVAPLVISSMASTLYWLDSNWFVLVMGGSYGYLLGSNNCYSCDKEYEGIVAYNYGDCRYMGTSTDVRSVLDKAFVLIFEE